MELELMGKRTLELPTVGAGERLILTADQPSRRNAAAGHLVTEVFDPRTRCRRSFALVDDHQVDRVLMPVKKREPARIEPANKPADIVRMHETDPDELEVGAKRRIGYCRHECRPAS